MDGDERPVSRPRAQRLVDRLRLERPAEQETWEGPTDPDRLTRAVRGHGLMLFHGGFDGSAATTAAVGHEVVSALTASGLSTLWDGSPDEAIMVKPLTWHKRPTG
ncbi:DUF6891 domain-containing protein [Streptomyces thermoalcalitolerans]|uniref:DUF6891 domain-containing protein n=1 Tax=Streptomyces thermoalcalitolerans TaxID=65605 RepID=A0ABP3YSV8_9ACTN